MLTSLLSESCFPTQTRGCPGPTVCHISSVQFLFIQELQGFHGGLQLCDLPVPSLLPFLPLFLTHEAARDLDGYYSTFPITRIFMETVTSPTPDNAPGGVQLLPTMSPITYPPG